MRPGPHGKKLSVSTVVFLRDMLRIVKNLREAKYAIYNGKVKVNGVKRKSLHHGIGLMDVVELDGVKEIYRMIPKDGILLKPTIIEDIEKTKKLSKVKSKTTIKNNKTQIGFHDGNSIIDEADVSIGDTCILQIPEQKILEVIKLEKGVQGLITNGANAGKVGIINDIKNGTFVLPKRVILTLENKQIEIPAKLLLVVGKDKPVIRI